MPRRPLARLLLLLIALLIALPCGAFTLEEYEFNDPARRAEFRDLLGEIRCLVCQNESLAGSQAGLAQDLRNEVYRLMQEGRSRGEVVDFLVERYGDFVLYDPPLKLATLPIWIGPILLGVLGVFLLRRALVSKQRAPEEDLSAEEQARLQSLLARDDHGARRATPDDERSPRPGSFPLPNPLPEGEGANVLRESHSKDDSQDART